MKLSIEEALLDTATERLRDAAATGNIGRSYPVPETITDAAETIRLFFRAVRIGCEAIGDGADHAATSASQILLGLDDADHHLARSAP